MSEIFYNVTYTPFTIHATSSFPKKSLIWTILLEIFFTVAFLPTDPLLVVLPKYSLPPHLAVLTIAPASSFSWSSFWPSPPFFVLHDLSAPYKYYIATHDFFSIWSDSSGIFIIWSNVLLSSDLMYMFNLYIIALISIVPSIKSSFFYFQIFLFYWKLRYGEDDSIKFKLNRS